MERREVPRHVWAGDRTGIRMSGASVIDLRLGDCLEIMRGLPDGCVDAVITDPPFGIGYDYSGTKEVADNPVDYWKWFEPYYREIERVVKDGGFIAIWQAQANFRYFWDWFGDNIHIYCSAKNFVQLRDIPINYGYEPVVMKYKNHAKPLRPKNPPRSIDYHVGNTAGVISDVTRIEKGHPCPRPLDSVKHVVNNFSIDNGTVLDPFMGSGTTGVACVKLNRSFIGIEINPDYFAIAQKRIAEAQRQMVLL